MYAGMCPSSPAVLLGARQTAGKQSRREGSSRPLTQSEAGWRTRPGKVYDIPHYSRYQGVLDVYRLCSGWADRASCQPGQAMAAAAFMQSWWWWCHHGAVARQAMTPRLLHTFTPGGLTTTVAAVRPETVAPQGLYSRRRAVLCCCARFTTFGKEGVIDVNGPAEVTPTAAGERIKATFTEAELKWNGIK